MFFLSLIEHTLCLPPHLLNLPLDEAIKGELETLFLDKVIPNLGLCISIYDIRDIKDGFIYPGDGASTYTVHTASKIKHVEKWNKDFSANKAFSTFETECTHWVQFRLVMFRPFVGEIIVGKLKSSDANGLKLSISFFDDIHIPVHLLPNPSSLMPNPENKHQGVWSWEFQDEQYPIDGKDEIRFRVHSISYPPIPIEQEKEAKPFAPMVITGSLDYDGLGPISWWV
uniref:DNA-directed RNA polymerase subunit n=1 Tax=Nelumbo nucifera TaxID=4432 RepID=A0A822XKS5_NELNU|nr:TPA_asm: hypothetical protein HUJ06_021204 [Nelumbo nucifera]